jgi:lipopolysaccharide transport system ATP-binding protein
MTQSGIELRVNENRFGSLEAEITDVTLQPNHRIRSGDPLSVTIHYNTATNIETPIFSITISREDGQPCLDINTADMNISIDIIDGQGNIKLNIDRLDLSTGKYFINVGLYEKDWSYAYDYHWHVYPFTVQAENNSQGILNPPMRWEVYHNQSSHIEPKNETAYEHSK